MRFIDYSTASWSRGLTIWVLTILVAAGLLLCAVAVHAAEGTAARAAPPKDWDEAVGLWIRRGPGHTRPVADLPQVHNGTIAAFFIGGPLIVLDVAYGDQLDAESRTLLTAIFKDLKVWFDGQAAKLTTKYPDKYMADVVYAWLLAEKAGDTAGQAKLATIMHQAAREWRDGHRGWGERLIDGYCGVVIEQLSILLLLSKTLPDGRTWSIQHGGDAVVLRIMPVVPASWDAYEDHLQIIRPTGQVTQLPTAGPMSGLDLSYPERTFSLRLVPLEAGGTIERTDLSFPRENPGTLWGLSMNGSIDEPPNIEPLADAGDGSVRVEWTWTNGNRQTRTWRLRIDPTAEIALAEEQGSGQ